MAGEGYEDEEDEPVVIRPERVKKRLPGVKLLKQLARERERERKIDAMSNDMNELALE
jgi:hypothetical protein